MNLKKKKNEYDAENDKNKDLIAKLKKENREIYKNEIKKYKEKVKQNKKYVIKEVLQKLIMQKVKIDKLKKTP